MLFIGLLILLSAGFPILYQQQRVGKRGKVFNLYKFRTMVKNADNLKAKYSDLNQASGPVFKVHDDPRFTKLGKFLSHTGLDELPQLFNVLKGEMALIGPRPLPVIEAKELKSWQKQRQAVKPGVISPWILNGYHSQAFNAWMKSDIAYIRKKNPVYDSVLFLKALILFCRLVWRELNQSLPN